MQKFIIFYLFFIIECEEADLEVQMFVLAQMFIRIPNVQFSTEPAFSQNPCCAFGVFNKETTNAYNIVFHF